MECPICFDAITASSGSTILSCSHTFHLSCIVSWFSKGQGCPCCRSAPSEKEMIEHDSCKQLELALQIVKRELSAVERLVIKNLRGSQKEFYDFSVYLEDIYPSLFQHELYEGILFEAFLFTRIEKAREYSQSLLYGDLYAQFVMRSVDP